MVTDAGLALRSRDWTSDVCCGVASYWSTAVFGSQVGHSASVETVLRRGLEHLSLLVVLRSSVSGSGQKPEHRMVWYRKILVSSFF